jgi:RPA family protein
MSARPNRETAYRVFAAEFDDASLSYAESDEERAPNYVVTPTGARLNRLFVVGVLTEIESVNDEQLRARIVDPTGAFVVYAGQYQPEALSFLERADTPAFVAVTGKARTFRPDDSEQVFTSIRPESLSDVDAATRDRFVVDAAAHTIERVRTMREARERDERGDALREALEDEGVGAGLAAGVPRALDHYDTTPAYLDAIEEVALDAARVVAGEREEVGALTVAPDERSTERAEPTDSYTDSASEPANAPEESGTEPAAETGDESVADGDTAIESEPAADSPGETDSESSAETESTGTGVAVETDESETETAVEDAQAAVEDEGDRGADDSFGETDESSNGTATEADDESAAEADLDDPEEFEIDADERERIEQEYGTDFESAAEVDEPGEADIETPTPEEPDETDQTRDEAAADDEAETMDAAEDDEIDPEEAVVAAMAALDEGDGAEREAVIERVGDEHGLTREAAADGIQSALMSGECYEPDDDTLKSI